MNFCWVTLHVQDLHRSLEFYRDMLELPVDSLVDNEHLQMAMLGEPNQPKIELIVSPDSGDDPCSSVSVGVNVESIGDIGKKLKAKNVPIIRGPVSPSPDMDFLFVADPDGFVVQLVQNI